MDKWFGAIFGFGVKRMPKITSKIIRHYMPRVVNLPWPWTDGPSLSESEKKGGVTLRARRVQTG